MTISQNNALTGERADILALLADQRSNFLITVRGIDDTQARQRTTVSDLTLGGLIKHVAQTERHWVKTIVEPAENAQFNMAGAMGQYYMREDEMLSSLRERYAAVAKKTETPPCRWALTRGWSSELQRRLTDASTVPRHRACPSLADTGVGVE